MRTGDVAQVVTIVCAGVAGLMLGSFLNVVIYRVPRQLSIVHPPSHCPACDAELGPLDMVPVLSWLALRGRCRRCKAPISARYPLIELATGAAFAGLAAAVGSVAPLPSVAVVVACALVAAVIDADGAPVPWPVATLAVVAAVSLAPVGAAVGRPGRVEWAVLGGALVALATLLADRTAAPGRWRAGAVVASLGWCSGWLWPGGGPLTAAWVVVATTATLVGGTRRVPVGVLAAGAFGIVITGAALGRA